MTCLPQCCNSTHPSSGKHTSIISAIRHRSIVIFQERAVVTAGELGYDPDALMQRCVTREFNIVANVFITVSGLRLSMLFYTSNVTNITLLPGVVAVRFEQHSGRNNFLR